MNKILLILMTCILTACGGGGGSSNSSSSGSTGGGVVSGGTTFTANAIPVTVSAGPQNNYLNGLFGSITLCNSSNVCKTVDNVIFDTGSTGVRVLASALPTNFLTATTNGSGRTYSNCTAFASGYTWGDVASATITLGSETTTQAIPVQVIGQSSSTVPSTCSVGNGVAVNTLSVLGANGIIGIGLFKQDCGAACANAATTSYYTCASGSCAESVMPLASQISNPVASMPANYNNGTVVTLPAISDSGASNVAGHIYLGINTATNNTLTTTNIFNTDEVGYLTVTLTGQTLTSSFIDSGSSLYAFNTTKIPLCTQSGYENNYCASGAAPTSVNISLTSNVNSTQTAISSIEIGNAYTLLTTTNNALSDVATQFNWPNAVDLGLPFFFGKSIATGLEGSSSSLATGTYFAF